MCVRACVLACFRCHCRDVSNQHLSPLYVGTLKHLRECLTRSHFVVTSSFFCYLYSAGYCFIEPEMLLSTEYCSIMHWIQFKATVSWVILQVVQKLESSITEIKLIKCILRCKYCIYSFLCRWYHIVYTISKTVGMLCEYHSELMVLSQMCNWHMPCELQMLDFDLCIDNKPLYPRGCSVISKKKFKLGFVRPQDSFPLRLSPSQMTLGPEKPAAFLNLVYTCFFHCMVEV